MIPLTVLRLSGFGRLRSCRGCRRAYGAVPRFCARAQSS
jgi:hypothetical protein